MVGEMVACPQCVASRLNPSRKTTIVKISNSFTSINWTFEDTMCRDAPLYKIHVFDLASDWLLSNWIVNKKLVLPLITLFARSLGDLLGLDQYSLVKYHFFAQLKYVPFFLFFFSFIQSLYGSVKFRWPLVGCLVSLIRC